MWLLFQVLLIFTCNIFSNLHPYLQQICFVVCYSVLFLCHSINCSTAFYTIWQIDHFGIPSKSFHSAWAFHQVRLQWFCLKTQMLFVSLLSSSTFLVICFQKQHVNDNASAEFLHQPVHTFGHEQLNQSRHGSKLIDLMKSGTELRWIHQLQSTKVMQKKVL